MATDKFRFTAQVRSYFVASVPYLYISIFFYGTLLGELCILTHTYYVYLLCILNDYYNRN